MLLFKRTYRLILTALAALMLALSGGVASAAVAMPDGGGLSPKPAVAEPARKTVSSRAKARSGPVAGARKAAGAAPATKPRPRLRPAPDRYRLYGVPHEFQARSNCGPVTTNMVLGYYGVHLSQAYTASKLRPNPADVSVNMIEMTTFAEEEYGFRGELGWGGNMAMVEQLIAHKMPVIVLQAPSYTSDLNHLRLVHGYDRERGTVTVSDSYYGPNLTWSYDYFRGLWDRRGNGFAVIYPRSKQPVVRAILHRYLPTEGTRRARALERSRNLVESRPYDSFAWLRLGGTYYHGGRSQDALRAWNKANALGLPRQALWYAAWPVSLMNDLGRYADARDLATQAVAHIPGSSEMYYERARAYHALGRTGLARENLELAAEYAPYHPLFREAAEKYTGKRWVGES